MTGGSESRGMTMYWIYDIPNWALGVLTVAVFVVISLAGLFATRPLMRRCAIGAAEHNDVVNYYVAAVGVLYSLALPLIAVAPWEDCSAVDGLIANEAEAIAGLYR